METLIPIKNINTRNYHFDFWKGLFAIFVILVHFPFPGNLGKICSAIGICGVIFFFLISGYSAYNKDDEIACNNLKNRFKRNLIILGLVLLIYFVLMTLEQLITGQFEDYLSYIKNPWFIPRLLFLGDLSFIKADQLWFMFALLYSYLVLLFMHKYKLTKYFYYFLPILLLARIGVETYVNTYNADWHYTSFFLTSGFPIMLLGHFIACKKEAFLKAPTYVTIILTLAFTSLMFTTLFVRFLDFDIGQIFKILCIFELFILTLKVTGNKEIKVIGLIGRKYSLYIYLFHFLVGIIVIDVLYIRENPEWVYNYLMPVLAVIFGTLVPIGLYKLNNKIKLKRKSSTKQISSTM